MRFAVLSCCVFLALGVALAAEGDPLSQQAKACDDNVAYFRSKIDGVVTWSNIFMVAGAITAALGSAFAGFLTKDGHRRAAALLGALGAVITVLPKTLPDKEALQAHLSAAEKHRVLGSKIRNQLGFAQPGESVIDAEKYASARFTDCASVDPPSAAPDLPEPAPQPLTASLSPALAAAPIGPASTAATGSTAQFAPTRSPVFHPLPKPFPDKLDPTRAQMPLPTTVPPGVPMRDFTAGRN